MGDYVPGLLLAGVGLCLTAAIRAAVQHNNTDVVSQSGAVLGCGVGLILLAVTILVIDWCRK